MADFYIQTDKQVYFAGQTVNGQVFVNVGTMITGAQGVSLKFTGYQCVKWVQPTQLHRPRPNPHAKPGTPPPYDPIAAIPPNQLHNHPSETIDVSDVESEDDRTYDHRPKFIKTPQNRYFSMKYYETRNTFAKQKNMIYQCNGFAPGQYSFPFSFKTFEGWPASFQHITQKKKGVIIYRMTVALQPTSQQFNFKYSRQINLRQTRVVTSQHKKSQAQITSCCCLSKGITSTQIHFQKDGYMPGQLVQMVMQVQNRNCKADIPTINISISNTVTMKSSGASTSDGYHILGKQINGVAAGQSATGQNAIRQAFNLQSQQQIKPTCSGKLLSNNYHLAVSMNHDISCDCCSDHVGVSIPIIIFPVVQMYNMPNVFQNNWAPKQMPNTIIVVSNKFDNFNLSQMQQPQQQPPPPPQQNQVYPQNQGGQTGYPPGQQQMGNAQMQQGYGQQQGYPPGQGGYGQQEGYGEQAMHQTTQMQMY